MLKTDYLDPEWEGNLVYAITQNTDNTISFTDATTYINSGDYIQAVDINTTNAAVNEFAELYKLWIGGSYTALPTSYQDAQFEGKKRYRKTDNGDGTVGLEDVTAYTVNGTTYAANDINTANTLLNSFTNGYESGMDDIITRLTQLGVTDTSDLISAIDTMASVQNSNGVAQGKEDVQTNPNNYNLYTPAQYNSKKTESDNKKNILRTASSQLAPAATNSTYYVADIAAIATATSNARTHANSIVKNMNEPTAMIVRSQTLQAADGIKTASSYVNYVNAMNSAINTLRTAQ